MIRTMVAFFRACFTFMAVLWGRRDRITADSSGGHPLLEGWDHSVEARVAEEVHRLDASAPMPARAALYCFDGPHVGEVFLVRRELETLGPALRNSLVVTPKSESRPTSFQLDTGGGLRLIAGPGDSFRLNGSEERESDLYDFDRVELMGNRFLVLELGGFAG